MPAARITQAGRYRGLRILLIAAVAIGMVTAVAGCVGPGSAEAGASDSTAAAGASTSTRVPSSGSDTTPTPTPSPTPTPAPSPAPAAVDPLAGALVTAGHTLSEGTAGLTPVEARAALDQATATLEADVGAMSASGAHVDAARIAADIDGFLASTHSVRQGVVESAIRVVNDEAPNADPALRDALYLAIVDQQAQISATDDTPRQVLDLVAKLLAVQDSEAAFAAEQQAAEPEQRPDGGGPADAPAMHTFPPPDGGGPSETYCPDASHPDYCLPVGPLAPVG
ncbi:hypothetical protein [Herbiconiux ginsengi]|uniref:Lipoprotein n=1 Tax=Herbiconiux ginsengi TaxID=381665 RepID=A0A1H3MK87_9MICO|nr:hypothetical protein [Herbiconiux ginsengi]SDY76549.1 hypothetical protein SAMN05216554_1442 [Herbiconiux ginsengi]